MLLNSYGTGAYWVLLGTKYSSQQLVNASHMLGNDHTQQSTIIMAY